MTQPGMVPIVCPNSLPSQNSDLAYTASWEQLLGWSFLQTMLKLSLGTSGQGKAMPWSILTSRIDDHVPGLEFHLDHFWFASMDEVDGTSMVGTFSLRRLLFFESEFYTEF